MLMKIVKWRYQQPALWLLPLVYALGIGLYTPPASYDLSRFYWYYDLFTQNTWDSEVGQEILRTIPDYLSQMMIYISARLGVPIQCFLMSVTYLTVFNFLYVFQFFYTKEKGRKPEFWEYGIVFCALPLLAVLSGVRNIHALSFVALALLWIDKKKILWALGALVYAALFHFSTWIYFLLYLIYIIGIRYSKNPQNWIKKQWLLAFVMSIVILIIKFLPSDFLALGLPESWLLKVNFYLKKNDILVEEWRQHHWKSVFLQLLYTYAPMLTALLLFKKELKTYFAYTISWAFVLLPCVVSLLFPNIFSRYTLLTNIALTMLILIKIPPKSSRRNFFISLIILIFGVKIYLFFKTIFVLCYL
ncbi:EpsG family protein [Riemerella columbina]|uniref:EpsG family protein n=1 Tax=Riemerella columbina TaxID=103810 RepID=UPI00267097C9|nr:EpsG family protein [Riemerella columbina]WKS94934.1 EpsG family protein [Riemerella columbina]